MSKVAVRRFSAQEAKLHEVLTALMSRLAHTSEASSSYQERLEEFAARIQGAQDLAEVSSLLAELEQATEAMAADSQFVHDELVGMQEQVQTTDTQIAKLHAELDRLDVLARHDALTGALNRKGMDEAVHRELSKMRRTRTPLSVVMVDIDNFKKLNDSLGHAAGDAALRHLAVVARECLRPMDTVARYGGEEFLMLLPDTPLERGIEAIQRLQKVLAQRPFTNFGQQVDITFSAGVAQCMPTESMEAATKRADEAMYQAKRGGKNRVVGNW
jgi:diguanylate cyclase